MQKGQKQQGTVEGTGSAINIELGFVPSRVTLYNIDDAGGLAPKMEWISGMADGSAFKYLSIADDGTTTNKSHALVTSNGVTPYGGAAGSAAKGFTIGADSDMNASGETILWLAEGESE